MKKKKLIHKFFPYFLSCSMVLGNILPVAADSNTLINGTVEASKIDISASGTTTYTINGKTLTSDSIGVLNNSNFPISIGVAKVEKTIGTLADVLPDSVGNEEAWFNLGRKDSNSKIALGLKHTSGDYLEEITPGTLYFKQVQDSSKSIGLGAVEAKGSANYEIDGFHGLSFSSDITEQYKITWDISLYGSGGNTTGNEDTYSVDREEDTPLNYELTPTSSQVSIKDTLTDLFGVHTVQAAPVDVPKSEVSNVVGEATITGLKDKSITELYIADYYEDENGNFYKITGIKKGKDSYDPTIGGDNLETVVIPEGITEIPAWAFCNNQNLKSITIPESVVSIGQQAFYYCKNLHEITIPNSQAVIYNGAFGSMDLVLNYSGNLYYNTVCSLANWGANDIVVVSDSGNTVAITSSNKKDILGALTGEVTIPDSISHKGYECKNICIANSGLNYSKNITALTIPESVKYIGSDAFINCTALETVNYNPDYEYMSGFESCTALKNVTIGSNVTGIEGYAFKGCVGLEVIDIPSTVEDIGSTAFQNCTNLTTIYYRNKTSSARYNKPWGATKATVITE